jgi:hypothetical protein
VISIEGAHRTTIDPGRANSAVRFHTGEQRDSVLSGFTLEHGNATEYPLNGGGVQIFQASPTIRGNIVRNNSACSGNGIAAEFSNALIVDNYVHHNRQGGCSGGTVGGGILIGAGAAEVTDNLIEHNQTDMAGGGIGVSAASQPLISRNTIRFNESYNDGGGVSASGASPIFVNNAVYRNMAARAGGGVAMMVPSDVLGGFWVNNTIADNEASQGSELHTDGFAHQVQLTNNILFTSLGASSVFCNDAYDTVSPIFRHNDIYASNGAAVGGICAAVAGRQGNIAVDPLFNSVAKGAKAYALTAGSPAIDTGARSSLPGDVDLLGRRRRVDGNGDDLRVVDQGAIEYGAH